MEVICYIGDVYLLSKSQITSFKMEKLQQKLRDGLNKDKQNETQIMIGSWLCVLAPPTLLTAEVRQSHILQRDLLQKGRTLAARITGHNLPTPQPIAEPGQPAVTIEGVGQKVTGIK